MLARTSFSCTFSIHRLETVLVNIVIDWQEQFWTRPCLQSFCYIPVKPVEKTCGSSQKRLYHFPQLAILGIQFITNIKSNVCAAVTRCNTTAYNIIKSHRQDKIAWELNVFLIFQSVFFQAEISSLVSCCTLQWKLVKVPSSHHLSILLQSPPQGFLLWVIHWY